MSKDYSTLIKTLCEMPHGQAQLELRKRGLWDEKGATRSCTSLKTYRVRVEGTIAVSAVVTVRAASDDEAEEKAMDMVSNDGFDWGSYAEADDLSATIEKCEE